MLEPNMIKKIIKYEKELKKGNNPKGEDFINKTDLLSNDIFCIVFTTLTLCNNEFVNNFKFSNPLNNTLIDFNIKNFMEMIERFLYLISHDKVLVEVFQKLLNYSKNKQGK